MTVEPISEWLTVVVGGGLVGKIVWDWLKERRRNGNTLICPYHETHHGDIEELKRCTGVMKRNVAQQEIIIAERTNEIFKQLAQGREDFKAIRQDISKMLEQLAAIKTSISGGRLPGNPGF